MKNKKGFTLVELLVTLTIAAILSAISIPNLIQWNKKDKFINQSREIVDMINDARTNALSEKKCADDKPSVKWNWHWEAASKKVELNCYDNLTNEYTLNSIELDNNIKIPNSSQHYSDSATTNFDPNSKNIDIYFYIDGKTSSINIDNNELINPFEIKKIKFPLIFAANEDDKRTICFDRFAGFPTISKTADCAE